MKDREKVTGGVIHVDASNISNFSVFQGMFVDTLRSHKSKFFTIQENMYKNKNNKNKNDFDKRNDDIIDVMFNVINEQKT